MKNAAGVVLTSGPIAPSLIRFALPFLGSSVVQQLYNTVDVMFVATLVGTNAAAAVGGKQPHRNLYGWLFYGPEHRY